MNKKILTVSVAAYNVEKYIEQCLSVFCVDEIADKTEVFVVDDGGTDSTREKTKEFEKKYPNTFKFLHKENGGWGSTINESLKFASGKYFKQLDGDDCLSAENLIEYINVLEKTDADLVFNPFIQFDDLSGKITGRSKVSESELIGKKIDFYKAIELVPKINMHCSTFKTELLQKNSVSVIEKAFYSDADYFIKGLVFVESVLIEKFPVYCYRIGEAGQSVSKEGLLKHYKDNYRVIDGIVKYVDSQKIEKEKRTVLRRYICDSIAFHYETLVMLDKIDELREFDKKVFGEYGYDSDEVGGNRMINKYRKFNFNFAYPLYCVKNIFRDNKLFSKLYLKLRGE